LTIEFITSEGLMEYPAAVAAMEAQVAAIADGVGHERVWFLEHPPVYTAGTSATPDGLRSIGEDKFDFPIYETGRGGQYTYHGPGQRVAYVMLDLRRLYPEPDIKRFVHDLEQWIINTLQVFDIKGERRYGRIGIWVVDPATGIEAKIAALGIRVRRGVAFHGISINLNPDLSHFDGIVPCGISEYGVTSFEKLGLYVTMADLDIALKEQFYNVFGVPEENNCIIQSVAV
jgi:lipoyl(octanoyl) transferase